MTQLAPPAAAFDQLPPHSIEAEQCLLASLALDMSLVDRLIGSLAPPAFFQPDHQIIFSAIIALRNAGRPVDPVLLREQLITMGELDRIGGTAYLADILDTVPGAANGMHYASIVIKCWRKRWLIRQGLSLLKLAYDPSSEPIAIAGVLRDTMSEFCVKASRSTVPQSAAEKVSDRIDAIVDGRWKTLPFAWPMISRLSKAILPGAATIVFGTGGDGKTFWLGENLIRWHSAGINVKMLILEQDITWFCMRLLAVLARNTNMTDDDWIRANPAEASRIQAENMPIVDEIGKCVFDRLSVAADMGSVADWIVTQAQAGTRLIIVDPITAAQSGDRQWIEDRTFLRRVEPVLEKTGASLVLVSHPNGISNGKDGAGLNNIGGGKAWERFTQCVIHLRRLDEPKRFNVVTGNDGYGGRIVDTLECNRVVSILKSRNGRGTGLKFAYTFDPFTLAFQEHGIIDSEAE